MPNVKATLELDTKKAQQSVNSLKGALTGLAAGLGAKEVIGLADQFTSLQNRIRAVTGTSAEATSAFNLIKGVAEETRSGLGDVADLFSNLTIATEEMGLTQQEVANISSTFSKALKISGADANATAGAIRQFGQALASGVLRGDEFNSIMEANPAFMREVASVLGVNVGQLREMAAQGLLTSDVMVKATEAISDTIDEDFGKTISTIGESFVKIKNNLMELLGTIEERTGVFSGLAKAIEVVADNLDIVAVAIAGAFGAAAVAQVANMVTGVMTLVKAFRSAAMTAGIMQGIIGGPAGLAKVIGGMVVAGGAMYAMNKLLDESTDTAEDLTAEAQAAADAAAEDEANRKKAGEEARALLQTSIEAKEEEKAKKKEQDEQLRILARQREEFNAITGELAIQSQEFSDSLNLQTRMLTALEDEKALIQGTANIEADRAEALRDLNDLTLISADERAQKEAEINDEFDDRISLLKEQVDLENQINTAIEQRNNVASAVSDISVRISDLILFGAMQKTFDSDERVRMQQRHDLAQQIALDEIALEDKFRNIRLAKEIELGRELTETELAFLKERFDQEKEDLDEINAIRLLGLTHYLEKLDEVNETSRSFGTGFQEAFMRLNDEFTNMAEFGGRIVDTMSQGFTDSIMKFVETGKLSFKDLFQSLLAEIVKMLANRAFLALFSPDGGVFGSLFAGFFEHGGVIPPGKFGIAGEAGPELVRGPATVVSTRDTAQMMAGGAPVTYNINAVDARSFQQLVAADPEFIYNVTRAGARRMPAR